MFSGQPKKDIHVVAGLLQDHGAAFFAVAPVAAYKAMRLVPIRHIFNGLNGYNIPYCSRIDQTL